MNISNFKFKKPELSFSDLDTPYQYHFIKELALTAVGLVVSVIFFVLIKEWICILFAFLAAIGYSLYVLWQVYKSLSNRVLVVDAKCIDLERKENKVDFLSKLDDYSLAKEYPKAKTLDDAKA